MNDRAMADMLGRQLLALRAQADGLRVSLNAQLDGLVAQVDAGMEMVLALQDRAKERAAAATVEGPAEEPAELAGVRVFGRRTATAGVPTGEAPPLPAVPDSLRAQNVNAVPPEPPAATGGANH